MADYICGHCNQPITGGMVSPVVIDGQKLYLHSNRESERDGGPDCVLNMSLYNQKRWVRVRSGGRRRGFEELPPLEPTQQPDTP